MVQKWSSIWQFLELVEAWLTVTVIQSGDWSCDAHVTGHVTRGVQVFS